MAHATPARGAGMVFVTPMQLGDLPEVLRIDEASFPKPWPEMAWRHELLRNSAARCYVARPEPPPLNRWSTLARLLRWEPGRRGPSVLGIVCMWIEEFQIAPAAAHIATIATHPDHRGRGVGGALLGRCLAEARSAHCATAYLEVRVNNSAAQRLYASHGFVVTGERPHYYSDNNEDAYLMTVALSRAAALPLT